MYSFCKKNAFTLIELIITMSILAILAMVALPQYHQFREHQEANQLLTLIRQNVNLSKSLANAHHNQIVICSSANEATCENYQWHKSMIIFMDLNQNKILESNEPVQKIISTDMKYGAFQWHGGVSNPNTITFQSDSGLPRGSQGNFTYCSFNHPENHRQIVINQMGHTRLNAITTC